MGKLDDTILNIMNRLATLEKRVSGIANRDAAGGYWITMPTYQALTPYAATTASHIVSLPRDLTLKKFSITTQTATTNNAGNHWTIQLIDFASRSITNAQTLEADTVGAWTPHTYTTFNIAALTVSACVGGIYLSATKVGSPGVLYIANPALFFI